MPRPCKPEGLCQGRECQNDHEKKAKRPGSSHVGTPKNREQDQTTGASCLCNAKTIIAVASGQQAVAPAITKQVIFSPAPQNHGSVCVFCMPDVSPRLGWQGPVIAIAGMRFCAGYIFRQECALSVLSRCIPAGRDKRLFLLYNAPNHKLHLRHLRKAQEASA